jgi:serine/threonine protein kinase
MIHRDVKPANILLTESGQPMLSDFGIAKVLETTDETGTLTGTGVGIGTPEYMAPEQGLGRGVDHRADIYSLGVVFYELVTGRKPYTADTPMAILLKQASEPLPRPKQFVRDLPEGVEKILFKALAKDPKDRFQSMGDFAVALEKLTGGTPPFVLQDAMRRSPALTIILVMTVIAIIVGGVFVRNGSNFFSSPTAVVTVYLSSAPALTPVSLTTVAVSTVNPEQTRSAATSAQATVFALTPSPTSTPTLIPTATSKPRAVFNEDFESGKANGFTIRSGTWQVVDDGTKNKVLEAKKLPYNWSYLEFGPSNFLDGIVAFRVKLIDYVENEQDGGAVGFLFRHKSWGGENYQLLMQPFWGSVSFVYQNPSPGGTWITFNPKFNVVFQKNIWYSVRVEILGNEFLAYLDGTFTTQSGYSSLHTPGLLAFMTKSGVQFDDIQVQVFGD